MELQPHDAHPGQRSAHAQGDVVGRRGRLLHADAGQHHRQYRAAGDGGQPRRESAADAVGDHRVFADDGGDHPGVGLAGRSLRYPPDLPAGDRAVRDGIAAVRLCAEPAFPGGGARGAGRRWRNAAAGRTTGGAADLSARAVPAGAELRCDSRDDRPADRADAGWVADPGAVVALDLSDQRAGRAAGRACHACATCRTAVCRRPADSI